MNNDEKLKEIGATVLDEVYQNDKTNKDWEYLSAVCYGQKIVEYGGGAPHDFFGMTQLDNETYLTKFNEKYPDKTEEEIWNEVIKPELLYCANKLPEKDVVLGIINVF